MLGLWYNSGDKSDSPPKRDGRGRAGWAAQTERDNGVQRAHTGKGERKMEQTESRLGRWTKQGMRFLKWLLYSAGIGLLVGGVAAAFHLGIDWAAESPPSATSSTVPMIR